MQPDIDVRDPAATERGPGRLRPRMMATLLVLALAVATGVGLSRAVRHDPGTAPSYNARTRQLTFTLPLFSGGEVSSGSLRGRPVVLNFYASWCGICQAEMPDFERIYQDSLGRVGVLGVNPQSHDNDASQAALVAQTGVTYPTIRDRGDKLLRLFDPSGALPVTVFLNAHGEVVRVVNGQLTEGKVARIVAADFGVDLRTQTPDRDLRRTGPPVLSHRRSSRP